MRKKKETPRLRNGRFALIRPNLLISRKSPELAEFVGIMLGDGNCQVIKEKSIYQIRIFGHKEDDFEYLVHYISPLFEKLFGIKPSLKFPREKNALVLFKQSKELVFTLQHFGIKAGNKTLNGTTIPKWIFEDKELLKACIRGLIDTDGCVCPKTTKHKTPTIWFNSASPKLRKSFEKAFKLLGYQVSKWSEKNKGTAKQCSIGKSSEVLRYYKEIGFHNSKHRNRFLKFCKCPGSVAG